MTRVLRGLALGCLLLAGAGCTQRVLLIRSQPEGSTLILDGAHAGLTPVEIPFLHYGTHEATLYKVESPPEGGDPVFYQLRTLLEVKAPPWQWPGVDILADLLWPGPLRDEHVFDLQLEPVPYSGEAEMEGLIQRAKEWRASAQEPLPDSVRSPSR